MTGSGSGVAGRVAVSLAVAAVAASLGGCGSPPAPVRTPTAEEASFAPVIEQHLAALAPSWWAAGDTATVNEGRLILHVAASMKRSDAVNACSDIADAWPSLAAGQSSKVKIAEIWVESSGGDPQQVQCAMVVPKP